MPTKQQIQLVQIARRQVGLDEQAYRLVLRNVAGVASTTQLDNVGVEDVMALMEDRGFRDRSGDATYWRDKVRGRGSEAGDRMVRKIETLAADPANKYPLAALVHRMSDKRTDDVRKLYPREAWMLIEALKAIVDRAVIEECNEIIDRHRSSAPAAVSTIPPLPPSVDDDCPF